MRWSLNLGRLAGIRIQLHVTFLMFVAWIAISRGLLTGHLPQALAAVALLLLVFLCVLLHELGHALTARRFGIRTRDITLLPIGGVARLEHMPDQPSQELIVAIAGPLVNVAIAAVLALAGRALHHDLVQQIQRGAMLETLLGFNVIMVLFNLIPAFPMDGGRVLRALLAMRIGRERATRVAATLGQIVAFGFAIVGLFGPAPFGPNPMLLFIALFVYLAAGEERAMVLTRASIEGLPVRAAMLTEFHQLEVHEPIETAVRHLMAGSQQDFPVLDDGRPVGVLTRDQLVHAITRHGMQAPVGQAIRADDSRVEADAPLDEVLARLRQTGRAAMPVTEAGRLVGLLTIDNVGDLLLVRQALRARLGDGRP